VAKKQEQIELQDDYTSEYRRAAQKWENQLIGLEQEFVEAVRKLANWPENERDSDLWNDMARWRSHAEIRCQDTVRELSSISVKRAFKLPGPISTIADCTENTPAVKRQLC